MNRRRFLTVSCLGALAPSILLAQSTLPPYRPRDWSGANPLPYPDPDLIALDPRFQRYILFNTPIQRHYTGSLWAEGPAWNGVGRYLVWSDIPNDRQLRWLEEDGHVTTFRNPSGHSNGNTFDHAGRQISCEHGGRRVVRYEPNGSVTVIADSFQGKRLNSPNDAVVHPDGSIWFTDPPYGIRGDYEGNRADSELPNATYRVDGGSGSLTLVTDLPAAPNGLAFSPDYRRLYIADTAGDRDIWVFDVEGNGLRNGRSLTRLNLPGQSGGRSYADGIRCDADGNIWAGALPGVQVIAPDGDTIGIIRLPERCANLCFGGSNRNRLFMAASQSLYSVYVGVAGAGIA